MTPPSLSQVSEPGPEPRTARDRAGSARVALVTCAALPDLYPDDQLLLDPLRSAGLAAEPAVWDDPAVDWTGFDLVVLRSPWDYVHRREEFLAWTARVPRLLNPPGVVAWNTDKRYLGMLAGAGAPVVPTRWLEPGATWTPRTAGDWVIKPAVSAGSRDTGRYDLTDAEHRELATAHLARLAGAGRVAMVQPYLPAVDDHGETSLLYFGGRYSHAIRKGPMLDGPDAGEPVLFRPEEIVPREPVAAEHAVAERVLAAVPGAAGLLYARVDLIPGPDGQPLLVELELTEPSVFLAHGEGAAQRFAAAIASRVPAA